MGRIDRLAAHAALLSLLAQLETYYSKAIKLQSVTEREVRTYSNEVDQIRTLLPTPSPTLPSPPAIPGDRRMIPAARLTKLSGLDISQQNTREMVLQLQDQLVDAQQARANKIEYEKIGKRIDRLPGREQGEMFVARFRFFFLPSSAEAEMDSE